MWPNRCRRCRRIIWISGGGSRAAVYCTPCLEVFIKLAERTLRELDREERRALSAEKRFKFDP